MWIWAYLVVYTVLSYLGTKEDVVRKSPRWYVVLTIIATILTVIGLVVYGVGTASPDFRLLWRWPAVFCAALFFVEVAYDVWTYDPAKEISNDGEISNRTETWTIIIGTVIGVSLMLPAIWINLAFAFNRM